MNESRHPEGFTTSPCRHRWTTTFAGVIARIGTGRPAGSGRGAAAREGGSMRPRTRAALHPEEASSLGAPVLVRRRTTPRSEGVRASLGAARVAAELITPRAQRPYGEVVDVLPGP